MKRVLIDYKKLDREVAALLIDKYPHGYGDDDIIVLKKPSGEVIEAVEVRTDDTVYLVKISNSLVKFISNFEETINSENIKQAEVALSEDEASIEFESNQELEPND